MFRGIVLALVLLSGEAAWAQQGMPPVANPMMQGTPQEQAACRRDSQRFCRDAIPDNMRVLACLQQNRDRISRGCREVLQSHGQ